MKLDLLSQLTSEGVTVAKEGLFVGTSFTIPAVMAGITEFASTMVGVNLDILQEYSLHIILILLFMQQAFGFKFIKDDPSKTLHCQSQIENIERLIEDDCEEFKKAHELLLRDIHGLKVVQKLDSGRLEQLANDHAPTRNGDTLVYDWKVGHEEKEGMRSVPKLVVAIDKLDISINKLNARLDRGISS